MDDLRALYQQVILDHSRNPRHFGIKEDAQVIQACVNPLCGDEITIYCDIDEQDIIQSLHFTGKGCAISVASASIMVAMMQNKPLSYFQQSLNTMHYLLGTHDDGERLSDVAALAKLEVLAGVKQFPSRVKCATCAWHTLAAITKGEHETVKTE